MAKTPVNTFDRVAVCSRSFSKHAVLKAELLQRYLHVTFNDAGQKLEGRSLVDFLAGHAKAIVALECVGAKTLAALPELRVISKYGVGLDAIDLEALRAHGVRLGWTGGVNRRAVAELALGLMITLLRNLPVATNSVRAGAWRQVGGRDLSGRTVGVVGCGHIGKDLTTLLRAFGCRVLVNDILEFPEFYATFSVEPVPLDDLLRQSDIVTLHVPLTASTARLIDRRRLSLMKTDAILVNTARGGIVDEVALREALENQGLAGAAFDVFENEPPADSALLSLPNFVGTPHIGGSSQEAVLAMGRAAIRGLDANEVPLETRDTGPPFPNADSKEPQ